MNRRRAWQYALGWFVFWSLAAYVAAHQITFPGRDDIFSFFSPSSPASPDERSPDVFFVRRVVDGDTIELASGETIRYIGIDAPESVKPGAPVECFAREASRRNQELVEGKFVRLERDVSEKDRYGRLLRHVYTGDHWINLVLVEEGYASAVNFPPDTTKQSVLREAEEKARNAKRGMWDKTACSGV